MRNLKWIGAAVALLGLLALPASAQLGGVTKVPALTFAGTTNITGSSTNTYAAGTTNVLYVENGDAVAVSWRFSHVSGNSGANVLVLAPAVEDGKPSTLTSQHHRFIVTANGPTETVGVTNITLNGVRLLYVISSEIPSAQGITNSTVSYRVSPK